jgi:hypothetical protein
MLRFENRQDFVEIDLVSQETANLPSRGDAKLKARVSSAGYAGQNHVWVSASGLRTFCRALVALERERQGQATLESISPKELRLVIRSVDPRGHMAAEGTLGHHIQREHTRYWHSVDFGFEFDPAQLLRAVTVGWIKTQAEEDPAGVR